MGEILLELTWGVIEMFGEIVCDLCEHVIRNALRARRQKRSIGTNFSGRPKSRLRYRTRCQPVNFSSGFTCWPGQPTLERNSPLSTCYCRRRNVHRMSRIGV